MLSKPDIENQTVDSLGIDYPCRVILFNDNIHTFDEVIAQLIKATGCNSSQAESIAWEAHQKGKACCYQGSIDECLRVSTVLEEIGLHTQIEP